jgi:hypothetical protein
MSQTSAAEVGWAFRSGALAHPVSDDDSSAAEDRVAVKHIDVMADDSPTEIACRGARFRFDKLNAQPDRFRRIIFYEFKSFYTE